MIYRFDDCALDTNLFELRRSGDRCPVEPQVFDVIRYLIENRGRVVAKEELLERLWPGKFVSEATLSSSVKAARKAIGDSGSEQRLIRTVHGRGFRFIGEVAEQAPGWPEPGALVKPSPEAPGRTQEIRYCTTTDGVPSAYSAIGTGPPLVRVLGWFTHLQMEWDWPEFRAFWERLAERFTVVRYDGRGIGLSGRTEGIEFDEQTRQLDLEAVIDAVGADSAALLAISEGGWTAAEYAVRNPSRVSHLILYGAYARGIRERPSYDAEEDAAMITLMRKGWGRNSPQFRQVFTSLFFPPDADPRAIARFDQLQRASADADTAARYQEASHRRGDGRSLFSRIATPTLVIHQREDHAVSFAEGQILAATVPNARFVPLPGSGHYFPFEPDTSRAVAEAIFGFTGAAP